MHDAWGVAHTQTHEIFQMRLRNLEAKQDMEEVTIPDMLATVQHIHKLATELHEVTKRIAPSVPTSLQRLRERPGIGLQFAKKGHPPGRLPKGRPGQR